MGCQPQQTQHLPSCCQVPHGDPRFYSAGSSQELVDGVIVTQGGLFACADPYQSLVVSSVCPQETGRGAHSLSTEGSPLGPSHCPQSFYQTLVAVHLHLQGCLMHHYIDDIFHAHASISQVARKVMKTTKDTLFAFLHLHLSTPCFPCWSILWSYACVADGLLLGLQ